MISLRGADVKVCLSIFWIVIWQMTDGYVFVCTVFNYNWNQTSDILNPNQSFLCYPHIFVFPELPILSNTVEVCRKISAFLNVSALNCVDTNGNIIYNMYDRLNRIIRTSNYLFRLYIRQRRKSVSSSVRHESRYKSFPLLRGIFWWRNRFCLS